MACRKIIQVEDGWQVWKKNMLVAVVDENGTLRAKKRGEWITLAQVDNSREIQQELDCAGVR